MSGWNNNTELAGNLLIALLVAFRQFQYQDAHAIVIQVSSRIFTEFQAFCSSCS
jgi:hypothetical protein